MAWTIDDHGDASDGNRRGTSVEIITDEMYIDHHVSVDMGPFVSATATVPLWVVAEMLRRAGYTVTAPAAQEVES